jgi:carboxyl-terminal processing protease
MRHRWLLIVAIVGAQAAQAAPNPVPAPGPANPKALQAESRRFAQQMNTVVERVAENYVRAVKREDLLEAAMAGLFQAAHKPVPRDLRSQIQQAVTLTSTLRVQFGDTDPKIILASSTKRVYPVERMLARLREEVGEADLGDDSVVIACRALAKKLDPHSGPVPAEEQRRMTNRDQETVGVGLELRSQVTPGPYVVEAVHAGSPAQRAGLRPGDVITALDGLPTGKALPESVLALRSRELPDGIVPLARPVQPEGQEATKTPDRVNLTYRRGDDGTDRTAVLIRECYRPESVQGVRRRDDNRWDYVLDAKARIAHVRVGGLSRGTSDELREVLTALREEKVKGIILDLRWSPGGYLNEAVEIADLFLGEALVATVKSRGKEDISYRSTSEGKFRDFTVVVLVNADTSGGAELIAAALQDHHRALVVGQRTLGKASVQTTPRGLEGIGFKLTSGTLVRPSGKNLHRFPEDSTSAVWGVVPDEDARLSLELGRRLKGWWQAYSLRPASSNERLALDDPRADPQQQAALGVLRKKTK